MTDKVNFSGVDSIANFIKAWTECHDQALKDAQGKFRFRMKLSNGSVLVRTLHQDFRGPLSLVGKCVDLESAYKQLAVRPSHAHLSICALKNPDTGHVEFFEMHALPFGASAAVHGFNRAAMAIEHILVKIFGLPCTHYFDDFTFVMPSVIADFITEALRDVLETLGWKVKGGDKDLSPDTEFTALGVVFDLTERDAPTPILRIGNKRSRVDSVCEEIRRILEKCDMTSNEAARLAGKLNFAKAQVFGKAGNPRFENDIQARGHGRTW